MTHLIAEHLIDLSDLLRSVGDRDHTFSMGTDAVMRKIGTRDHVREGPKEVIDALPIGIREQRAEVSVIRVATRDFR
ncbi:hypothetical protein [Microvirga sp. P5_D2]